MVIMYAKIVDYIMTVLLIAVKNGAITVQKIPKEMTNLDAIYRPMIYYQKLVLAP